MRPILEASHQQCSPRLLNQGWPVPDASYNDLFRRMYDYIKSVKSNVRLALEKSKGGKKGKPVKGKPAAEEKPIENCAVFVALQYPEWQQQVLEILQTFTFDEQNKIQGDFIKIVKDKVTGPKGGMAIKFAAFIVKEAETVGKAAALEVKTPFDERELLMNNREFIFENMPTIKNFKILTTAEEPELENSKNSKEAALPGKPSAFFY